MPQDTIPLLKTFYRLYMTKFKLPCMLLKISKILLLPKSSSSIIPATPCLPLYASGIQNCLCVPRTHTMFPSSGSCCSLSQQCPASALTPHHPKPDEILIILFLGQELVSQKLGDSPDFQELGLWPSSKFPQPFGISLAEHLLQLGTEMNCLCFCFSYNTGHIQGREPTALISAQ